MPYVLQINGKPNRWKIRPLVKSEANFVTVEVGHRFARVPRIDVAGVYPTAKDAVDARDRAQASWDAANDNIDRLEVAHKDSVLNLTNTSSALFAAKAKRRLDATLAAKWETT